MQMLKTEWSDRRWRLFLAFCAGAMLVFYMLCPVAPLRWADLYASYGKTAIAAFAAIYFFRARLDGVKEVKLVIWYTIWLFVSRLLNTDWYRALMFTLPGKIVLAICALVILITAMLMMKYTRPIEYKR